jgi:hypothetical protein
MKLSKVKIIIKQIYMYNSKKLVKKYIKIYIVKNFL